MSIKQARVKAEAEVVKGESGVVVVSSRDQNQTNREQARIEVKNKAGLTSESLWNAYLELGRNSKSLSDKA